MLEKFGRFQKNKPITLQTNTGLYLSQTSSVLHSLNNTQFNVFTLYIIKYYNMGTNGVAITLSGLVKTSNEICIFLKFKAESF